MNIVRALATVKYHPKGAFFSQGTYDQFKKSLGKNVNGVIVWSTWSPDVKWEGLLNGKPFSNQDFVKAFTDKYGTPPDEDHAQAFTVCQAAEQAIARDRRHRQHEDPRLAQRHGRPTTRSRRCRATTTSTTSA